MGWVESPVLTTITTTARDVTELDFPTITICREVESLAFWSLGWGEGGGPFASCINNPESIKTSMEKTSPPSPPAEVDFVGFFSINPFTSKYSKYHMLEKTSPPSSFAES